ncbi:hypothetical protein D0A34_26965 [Microcoleus vaginatus PCC 9802]|uniref:hypothetical protein n=1 Tax=Microcoleus vaginatus TaxID=119532 RepID=UPI00020D2F9B|nr:hypothetical protein MicvaDRAFT_1027 [Microcoleus vaginatus FGP-2]UNU21994.1 hypothetical protein D0A34_26965 [Microcoleus vaginatus PCC 9802]
MTALFRRIQPSKKLRITVRLIAQLLKISQNQIKRIESWVFVVFVHRRDRGGQFISYRSLEEWQNAIAHHIQTCPSLSELSQLKTSIHYDSRKFKKQSLPKTLDFFNQMYIERQDELNIWESLNCIAS